MKIRNTLIAFIAAASFILSAIANATPVSLNVSGVFSSATGSLSGLLNQSYASNFGYDTDTSLAKFGALFFSSGSGQLLSAVFSSPYTVSPSINGTLFYAGGDTVISIAHNRYISSAESNGMYPAGTYDYLAVNGFKPGLSLCSFNCLGGSSLGINDGVNFGIFLVGNFFTSDLTEATQMPDVVNPITVVNAVVHTEKWENGVQTGSAYQFGQINGSANSFEIVSTVPVPVPVPAAAWLLGSGLLGLVGVARRKAA